MTQQDEVRICFRCKKPVMENTAIPSMDGKIFHSRCFGDMVEENDCCISNGILRVSQ